MLSSKYRGVTSVVERGTTNLGTVRSNPARRIFFTRLIHTRKKIPYEKLVEYLLKITRVLMKSGTNLYSIKFYNIL